MLALSRTGVLKVRHVGLGAGSTLDCNNVYARLVVWILLAKVAATLSPAHLVFATAIARISSTNALFIRKSIPNELNASTRIVTHNNLPILATPLLRI